MRTSLSFRHTLVLVLVLALTLAALLLPAVHADTLPPDPPIEIVNPRLSGTDTTVVSDSLGGPDGSSSYSVDLLTWLMIVMTATF